MKNIFKVMGVALLACSMIMVSCKKDENEDSTVAEGINVTFDGQSWTAAESSCGYTAAYGGIQFNGAQVSGEDFPQFDEFIYATETGSWTEASAAQGLPNFAESATHGWVEYYKEMYITANGYYYGDWWAYDATTEITAVDLTALTASAKMNGTMFDVAEAYIADYGAVGAAAATHAPYSATFGNVSLTNM